jgi:Co/Zn/Cd efflux system component
MGIVGAGLVAIWAVGLLKETGRVLLDAEMDAPVVEEVREVIADIDFDIEITDLHVWRVGKGKYSCILAVATNADTSADFIREKLSIHDELVHITVEINRI